MLQGQGASRQARTVCIQGHPPCPSLNLDQQQAKEEGTEVCVLVFFAGDVPGALVGSFC